MARPTNKRGFRPIVVDGVRYHWRCDDNRTADLEVHCQAEVSRRGQRLCVNWMREAAFPITGRIVSAIIRAAVAEGWEPTAPGGDYRMDLEFPISSARSRALPDIEAQIHFLSTKSGGRTTPAYSGYRPQFFYDDNDWDAEHDYPETKAVQPGDTVKARLRFLSPHEHLGKVHVGMPFLIREGLKTVAYGIVTAILDIEASAEKSRRRL